MPKQIQTNSVEARLELLKDYIQGLRENRLLSAANFSVSRGFGASTLSHYVIKYYNTRLTDLQQAIRRDPDAEMPWEKAEPKAKPVDFEPQVGQRRSVWGGNDPNNWRWTWGYTEKTVRLGE